jgi:hypothetical protein
MTKFADKKITIIRRGCPDDTITKTNQEWVNILDASDSYAKRLIEEELQEMIVQNIAIDRCSGCNYKLRASKINETTYELS